MGTGWRAVSPAVRAARSVRQLYRRVGYRRASWPAPLGRRISVRLAVCAVFKDEARYLPEWVAFHRIQGVERFYLYDNGSSDDWARRLASEISSGVVEVQHWPYVPGQGSAYQDCFRRHRDDTRWIAFVDADEFLFSPTGRPLPDVLDEFARFPAVVVNWRVYGTNGWQEAPEGLVLENYPMRGPDDYYANALIKSIVYPRSFLGLTDQPAHYFRLRGNPVGEDKRPVLSHTRVPPTADLLRINHYYAKSEESFRIKSARPRADYGVVTDRFPPPEPAIRDDSVNRFLPELQRVMAERSEPT